MSALTIPRRLAALAVVGTLAMSVSGCSVVKALLPQPAPTRDAVSEEVVGGGSASVFAIKVGDCIADPASDDEVFDVDVVPCGDAHDSEAYFEFNIDASEYPGDDEVGQQADDGCMDAFADFVGLSYDDSTLDFYPFTPTESGWAEGDRAVTCMVGDPDGMTTGSLAGVAH